MRKISAHYCLLPDGSLAKMPVISVDENGVIREVVVFEDGFVEQHGIELFGGVLIPGFIEDFRDVDFGRDTSSLLKNIKRLYSKGSLKYLCNLESKVFLTNFRGDVFYDNPIKVGEKRKNIPKESVWEIIQRRSSEEGESVFGLIHNYFSNIKSLLPQKLKWGAIEPGANPGLIVIKGLDYSKMHTQEKTTIKNIIL